MRLLTAGTRGSALARVQTGYVAELILAANADVKVHAEVFSTQGDRVLDKPLAEIGGKGLFTEELEAALLAGGIDFAVHSLKDLPTDESEGLVIAAIPPRVNPLDAFVAPSVSALRDLPDGSRIGTSSLRRSAQLRAINSTWEIVSIRGNVQTRLGKIDQGLVDAVILAAAGLERLGLADRITEALPPETMLPACGQGALAVQVRAEDADLRKRLESIHDENATAETRAERAFLAALGGGCQVPIGALAKVWQGALRMDGCVCSLDGETLLRAHVEGQPANADALGREAAQQVMAHGAERIMAEIR